MRRRFQREINKQCDGDFNAKYARRSSSMMTQHHCDCESPFLISNQNERFYPCKQKNETKKIRVN